MHWTVIYRFTKQGAPGWCYDTFLPGGLGNRQTPAELLEGIEKLRWRV